MKLKELRDQYRQLLKGTSYGQEALDKLDKAVVLSMQGEVNITQRKTRGGLSPTEKRRKKVKENSPLMQEIGDWFSRQPETLWNLYEEEALNDLLPIPEHELETMAFFYNADIPKEQDKRRHSVEQLLNNWTGECDKAREYWRCNK